MIKRNEIFTYLTNALKEYNPDIFTITGRIYATSRFPTVAINETDYRSIRENVDLSEPNYQSTWEVEVYCDKASGGKAEASKIISIAESAMRSIGFRMTGSYPTENIKEITISRHIARFTRVLCTDDEI